MKTMKGMLNKCSKYYTALNRQIKSNECIIKTIIDAFKISPLQSIPNIIIIIIC